MNGLKWIMIAFGTVAIVAAFAVGVAAQTWQPCPIGGFATVACPIINDAVIQSTIVSRLAGSISSSSYPVTVRVHEGIVTITGQVADEARKQMATILAASMRGVVCINNNLVITGTTPMDLDLTRDIRKALGKQPFSTSGVSVYVVDRVAELRGEVATDYYRTQAGLTAESVPGVLAVHNNLIVHEVAGAF